MQAVTPAGVFFERKALMMNQQMADYWFSILDDLLLDRPMRTTDGTRYDVTAEEFMMMGENESSTKIQFKHRNTRNYVFIQNGELIVPRKQENFMRGFFDKGEM